MAFTPGSNEGDTNGTTNVTAVAAPAANTQRQVSQIVVHNVDTVPTTANIYYNTNGTVRRVYKVTLGVGETLTLGGFVLDSTTDSLEVDLDVGHTTTAPTFVSTYADFD